MKKLIVFIFISAFSQLAYSGKVAFNFTYSASNDNVHMVVDNVMKGRNMSGIKIDLNIVKTIRFFQEGYYSFEIKVSPKLKQFDYTIDLKARPEKYALPAKYLVQVLPFQNNTTVTNFTEEDLALSFKKCFNNANILIGNELSTFPNVANLKQSNLSISPTIVNYTQIKGMSIAPYYNLAEITINWIVINKDTKAIVYNKEYTSNHFIRYKNTTGLNSNTEMLKSVENAIDQGFELFLSDPDFLKNIPK